MKEMHAKVNMTICGSLKRKIIKEVNGGYKEQYSLLYAYARELKLSNPGTTTYVKVDDKNPEKKPYFSKFYVWFVACKKGWRAKCKPIIGIDGYFSKHICKKKLLCTVGRDENNQNVSNYLEVGSEGNKKYMKVVFKTLSQRLGIGKWW